MSAEPRNRKLFLWPAAVIVIGAMVAANPFYAPDISFRQGIVAWFLDMTLALICWANPITARAGMLLTGLFISIPCFLNASPLFRGWLMCGMFLPVVVASIPVLAPSVTGFRARLALLASWDHTREVKRSPRYFYAGALLHLVLATILFATALDAVDSVPAFGFWLPVRWLAGGVMILALAEMWTAFHFFLGAAIGLTAPSMMESPFLSASISEFWTKRWNPGTSFLYRRICFEPLAKRNPVIALFAVFILSGMAHILLFYMASLQWKISLINGSFFFIQPLFILTERILNVRRWSAAAGRAWTLAVLAITAPLFVEPALQVVGSHLGSLLPGTLLVMGLGIIIEGLSSLAALIACSKWIDLWSNLGYKNHDLVDKE